MQGLSEIPSTCGIYSIKHLPTNQQYVGGSRNMFSRCRGHANLLKQGKNAPAIQALYTDSTEPFSVCVLNECSPENLAKNERHWIHMLRPALNARGRSDKVEIRITDPLVCRMVAEEMTETGEKAATKATGRIVTEYRAMKRVGGKPRRAGRNRRPSKTASA